LPADEFEITLDRNIRPVFCASASAILVFVIAAHFARAVAEHWLIGAGAHPSMVKELSYPVVPVVLGILMYPYLRLNWTSCRLLLRRVDLSFRLVVYSVSLGVLMRIGSWAAIITLVSFDLAGNRLAEPVNGPVFSLVWPMMPEILLGFVVMCLLVPMTEEVVHRGFLLHSLLARGEAAAVVVSAAIFAASHPPQTYVLSFLAGLFLGMQTLSYRTLWAPFITHATFNAAMVIDQNFFYMVWSPAHPSATLTYAGVVALVITFVSICACTFLASEKAAGARR
jgi:membrane protease YdiL (CAAX protease family)